ncbi:hypothetical protein [Litoreibacter ponti]|uniref:hypothetical protein n=1 Tax=Litoreibacter ponti TaxID=1510457 RepID=UPI0011B2619B|nr:hypothetical protein [Litoreibacter ponti]
MSDKWGQLLQKLVSLTRAGKLSWNETVHGDEISTQLGEMKVEVQFFELIDEYRLIVRDEFGKEIDAFTDDELTSTGFISAGGVFASLFRTVKRQKSGADQALDNILRELDNLDDEVPF